MENITVVGIGRLGLGLALLIEKELLGDIRYLSTTKRVSKYCIEGERGFIHYAKSGGQELYKHNVELQIKQIAEAIK